MGILERDVETAKDSTPILGFAAVQDTYTLIRTGIEKTLRAIKNNVDRKGYQGFKKPFSFERYVRKGRSRKPDINWDDRGEMLKHLEELVTDARAVLAAVENSGLKNSEKVKDASGVLRRILEQDVDEGAPGGPRIKKSVARDRIISTNDPEMRHGRKSKSVRFDGFKGHVDVDVKTELLINVDVGPGNGPDDEFSLPMLEEAKNLYGIWPSKVYVDCAYGSGDSRAAFQSAGILLMAKLPVSTNGGRFPKSDFLIQCEEGMVTCPAGKTTTSFVMSRDEKGREVRVFRFSVEQCASCEKRQQCTKSTQSGRSVSLHYHEKLLQEARQEASKPEFRQEMKKRLVVERVIAHLKSYGLRRARYLGAKKLKFQALWVGAVYNLLRIFRLAGRTAAEVVT
jgi:hypothetical protein